MSGESRDEPRIEDYAAIGNLRTVALVHRAGSIDWLCWPRFDSEWACSRLIDPEAGGYFEVAPATRFRTSRRYLPGTNVLETELETAGGRVQLIDWMPWAPRREQPTRVLRRLEGLAGQVELVVSARPPRAASGGADPLELVEGGARIAFGGGVAWLGGDLRPSLLPDGRAEARLRVRPSETLRFELAFGAERPPPLPADEVDRSLGETIDAWRAWSGRIELAGADRERLVRSALVLKLLTYEPTGAVVAAPTTSLPEAPGGTRNWDYRFVWLRDGALLLKALMDLGHHDEAMAFWELLERMDLDRRPARVLYTVDGEAPPAERIIEALPGFRGSRPVRVGNGAADQLQLDAYGFVLEAAWECQTRMGEVHPDLRPALGGLADAAARRWREPDCGVWELRGPPHHFLASKLYCWLGLERALDLARRQWLDGDVEGWARERDAIRRAILAQGYDDRLGAFVQAFDRRVLDASALLVGLTGLLPPDDPRVLSTLDAVERHLMDGGFVRRYVADDGFPEQEGAFLLCTLWQASALATAGRVDAARALFEHVLACANDVGLLSEQVDPRSRELLGNFPQAYTHLAVIRTAMTLHSAESDRARSASTPATTGW